MSGTAELGGMLRVVVPAVSAIACEGVRSGVSLDNAPAV